ncbi:MAG TPA: alpha/beta hydrolase [Streptosporangiaceae bacterium]|nr:alpha/beta hydrolase [Streptosporangiaceae bacterium]
MDSGPSWTLIERHDGRPSLRSRVINRAERAFVRPYMDHIDFNDPRDMAKLARVDRVARRLRPARGTAVEPVSLGDFDAEWVHGRGVPESRSDKVVLYFHGGGWVFMGPGTHRRMLTCISRAARSPVLSVAYRMMPQVSFHAEIGDCLTAYRWLLAAGVAPADVAVAGDSAGGHLAFAMVLRARAEGLPMPGCIVALAPCLDLDLTTKLSHPNSRTDSIISPRWMASLHRAFLSELDTSDPAISPIHADLRGLCPVMLTVSATELLVGDSERMAERLAAAQVPHVLAVWTRQSHVFQQAGNVRPEAKASIAAIGAFIKDPMTYIGSSQPPSLTRHPG